MKFTEIIDKEYENVSETVVDKLVSPKKDVKLEYEVMPRADTYAEGIHALRNFYEEKKSEVPKQLLYECDGQKIIRPLTFRENILARVEDFETLKNEDGTKRTLSDRLRLFYERLDSCSGVAYSSQKRDEFMIIPICEELITMPKNFRQEFIFVDYDSLKGKGISFKKSQIKSDLLLTEFEVITHPAWIALVEEDMRLLITYSAIMFENMKLVDGKNAGFFLHHRMKNEDLLNSVFVKSNVNNSDIRGSSLFSTLYSFLRATQL